MIKSHTLLSALFALMFLGLAANAQVPNTNFYQGRLTDSLGNPVPDGSYLVQFTIYDHPTSTASDAILWQSPPQTVNTSNGLFNVTLGVFQDFPDSLFSDSTAWLGIRVEDPVVELTPRTRLVSVPYALHSRVADELDGTVNSTQVTNEPGIAANMNSTQISLTDTGMVDLVTVTITTPAEGYIVLHGNCWAFIPPASDTLWSVEIQIDETNGNLGSFQYVSKMGAHYNNPHTGSISVMRVYQKPAGTYTFRLEGVLDCSSSSCAGFTSAHFLTATYYPTSYGNVIVSPAHEQ